MLVDLLSMETRRFSLVRSTAAQETEPIALMRLNLLLSIRPKEINLGGWKVYRRRVFNYFSGGRNHGHDKPVYGR